METLIDTKEALEEALRAHLERPEDLHSLRVRPARHFALGPTPKARNLEVFLQDRFTCVDTASVERAMASGLLDSFAGDVLDRLRRKHAHHTEKFSYSQVLREELTLLREIIQEGANPEEVEQLEDHLSTQLEEAFPGSAPEGKAILAAHHAFLLEQLTSWLVWRVRMSGDPVNPPEAATKRKKKEKKDV
jgi:hypothetical protein